MTVAIEKLLALGFMQTHDLQRTAAGRLRFVALEGASPPCAASVYAWVATRATDPASGSVLYVGKAGRGIQARLAQHEGGFIYSSSSGRDNARLLDEVLGAGARISVFVRTSATMELFGQRVSLYAAEEDALCRLLRPSFNRAGFPDPQTAVVRMAS